MQEGTLGVWDEGVGDPEQRHQAPVHADALVPWEDQPGVAPTLAEEDGGGVVLGGVKRRHPVRGCGGQGQAHSGNTGLIPC